jgi:hypothetical protein
MWLHEGEVHRFNPKLLQDYVQHYLRQIAWGVGKLMQILVIKIGASKAELSRNN